MSLLWCVDAAKCTLDSINTLVFREVLVALEAMLGPQVPSHVGLVPKVVAVIARTTRGR